MSATVPSQESFGPTTKPAVQVNGQHIFFQLSLIDDARPLLPRPFNGILYLPS